MDVPPRGEVRRVEQLHYFRLPVGLRGAPFHLEPSAGLNESSRDVVPRRQGMHRVARGMVDGGPV